jgi:hypothetical protein
VSQSRIQINIKHAHFQATSLGLPTALISGIARPFVSSVSANDENRYELVAEGAIVRDHYPGLDWAAEEIEELPWEESNKACTDCRLGGHTDWRQPSREEQLTIVDLNLHNPCLRPIFKTHGKCVWTSTQTNWTKDEAGSSRSFWSVGMFNGGVYSGSADNRFRARPVRRAVAAGQ